MQNLYLYENCDKGKHALLTLLLVVESASVTN